MITLSFTGDLLAYHSLIRKSKRGDIYDFSDVFCHTHSLFSKSSYVIGNLETPIAGHKFGYTRMDMLFKEGQGQTVPWPFFYPARKIAKAFGAKLSYEVHDLWPLSPMLIGGYSKNHPFIRVMQKGEDDAYKYSDKVVSLLWNAEEHMREHGLAEGKFVCIPNGYSKDEWSEDAVRKPFPIEHTEAFSKLAGKHIIGFAGGFAASGALSTLIAAAEIIKDREDIHFVLVGKGPEKENIRGSRDRYLIQVN